MLNKIQSSFRALFRKRAIDTDMDDEMRSHIEMRTQQNIESGMNPEAARFAALRQFGWKESIKEKCRDQRGVTWLENLGQDIRYGARQLRKNPGFTTVAVLTLALGIGANTAIFSLFDAILLRPLPVKDPHELALLSPTSLAPGSSVGLNGISYPLYRALRDGNTVFNGLFGHFRLFANVSVRGETQRITAELVSGNYFEVLGVHAALGRTLTSEDDLHPGAHPVAVLSYDYWMNTFGGDPSVLGQALHFNGQLLTIVGVCEKQFTGVDLDFNPQVRVPMMMTGALFPSMNWLGLESSSTRWVEVFGRLKPGVSFVQAEAALQAPYHSWVRTALDEGAFGHVSEHEKIGFQQSSLTVLAGANGTSFLRRDWSVPLKGLSVMVVMLLILACVNLAGLFISRNISRHGEIAVRLALGANRSQIVRWVFTESLIIVLLGAAAGVWVASFAAQALVRFLPASTEGAPNITVDLNGRVILISIASTVAVALLSGLLPALLSIRSDLTPILKAASSRIATRSHCRRALVVAQFSLSLLLLFGGGLFVRSLNNLYAVAPGFETGSIVTFGVDPVLSGYPRARCEELYRRIKEQLALMPGIDSSALGLVRLLGGADVWKTATTIDGLPAPSAADAIVSLNAVSDDYFRTLKIAFKAGRDFRASDQVDSPPVVVVNESFVRHLLGKVEPLGRHALLPGPHGMRQVEIVGIVENSHYESLRGESPPQVFVPYSQFFTVTGMNGYVRSRLPFDQTASLIRAAIRGVDPTLPIHALRAMNQQRDRSLATERLLAGLAAVFGTIATLLAAVGLYGVLSDSVTRRTREVGLRMALGALPGAVARSFLKEALVLSFVGIAIGLPAVFVGASLIKSQLYGVQPNDPATLGIVITALVAITLIACWLPARRAARVHPMVALRAE